MRISSLTVALAAVLVEAAPQLGELADYAPALPFDVPYGLASSTRKSPGNGPVPITNQERFATGTTAGASGDGRVGVILEPDLVVGKPTTPGAKVVKIRSGPYTIPPGKFFDPLPQLIKRPCSNCYITAVQGVLEFENGTSANFQDGAWQHHMVVYTMDGEDATCGPLLSGAGKAAKSGKPAPPPISGRRIFGSGVERVPIRLNGAAKYGLYMKNNLPLVMSIELMSQARLPLHVYSAITYEYVEGPAAEGYKVRISPSDAPLYANALDRTPWSYIWTSPDVVSRRLQQRMARINTPHQTGPLRSTAVSCLPWATFTMAARTSRSSTTRSRYV